MKKSILASAIATLTLASTANADIVFNDFSNTSLLTSNGLNQYITTSDGVIARLTPANASGAGSFFSTAKINAAEFLTIFSFRITDNRGISDGSEPGADGLTFTIQNVANNVGAGGGGIGYQGISPSIAVEFDTFFNGGLDTSTSHVAIDVNGDVNFNTNTANHGTPAPVDIGTLSDGNQLDDGGKFWSWIDYQNGTLSVYLLKDESIFAPARPLTPILTYNTNLVALLGSESAFAGFTSGSASATANHDIISWRYNEAIPEPGTAAALLPALALLHRRR